MSRVNAMGTMASTLAHELNQPLTVIYNYASGLSEMLRMREDTDPEANLSRDHLWVIESFTGWIHRRCKPNVCKDLRMVRCRSYGVIGAMLVAQVARDTMEEPFEKVRHALARPNSSSEYK